jgi:hypothetical protein
MTPFGTKSNDQFRSDPPPTLTSDEYTKAYNEVKRVGDNRCCQLVLEHAHTDVTAGRCAAVVQPGLAGDVQLESSS